MKYNRYSDRIVGKIIIQAMLTNESPFLIGTGVGDASDNEVMCLPDGRPYIPASSIAGSLKSFMLTHQITSDQNYLWGREEVEVQKKKIPPLQSHIRFDDLIPLKDHSATITRRDGVKINHVTGVAEDKKKYDYQLVEPNIAFPFKAEITIRDSMKMSIVQVETFVNNLKRALHDSGFRIGAQTNTGFGKFACTDFVAYRFDFPDHAKAWFNFLKKGEINEEKELRVPEIAKDFPEPVPKATSFSIQANFKLKSSLMIGSYGTNAEAPDKSHLKSGDRYVLPGKSIRGAVRHRAVKILNTIMPQATDAMVNNLFGIVEEDKKNDGLKQKGRLRVEEFLFEEEAVTPMVQDRVKIDRFTGGAMNGALFNSEPVWTKSKDKREKKGIGEGDEIITLTFTILKDAKPAEKKLLLNLLKDLWLEDLAIGGEKNVGRGILIGQSAKIYDAGDLIAEFKRRSENAAALEFLKGTTPADINNLLLAKASHDEQE